MVLKLRHFGKYIRNILKVLTYGAGEGWRRSVGLINVENELVLHAVKEEINILHTIKRWKACWIGHILRRELPSKTGN
jgi:flagellar biogenesis protein FliO